MSKTSGSVGTGMIDSYTDSAHVLNAKAVCRNLIVVCEVKETSVKDGQMK